MFMRVSIGFSLLCVGVPFAFGQPGSELITTLSQLLEEVKNQSPTLRAARYRHEAATKRPSQAGALPDPKVSLTNFGVGHPFSGFNRSDFAYTGIGVSQELPFPGKLALAAEQAEKEAQSEGQMYRTTVLDTLSKLKVAYYDWALLFKTIEVTKNHRELLSRFETIARSRYAVGKGMQQDILKAQVELSSLDQQLELLEQKRQSTEAQLGSLLGRSQEAPFGRPAELQISPFTDTLESLLSSLNDSPYLRAKRFLVDSRAVGVDRSKKDYRPDFNVGFQWEHTGTRYPDYYMATVEVKAPLYFWRKQRFGSEEALAHLNEARENYRSAQQETTFFVKDQYLTAKASERVLALFKSGTIPQATVALESNVAGYEVGKLDFLSLLNSVSTLLTLERQYYEELAKHEQALARLEPLIGRELTQPSGDQP